MVTVLRDKGALKQRPSLFFSCSDKSVLYSKVATAFMGKVFSYGSVISVDSNM